MEKINWEEIENSTKKFNELVKNINPYQHARKLELSIKGVILNGNFSVDELKKIIEAHGKVRPIK